MLWFLLWRLIDFKECSAFISSIWAFGGRRFGDTWLSTSMRLDLARALGLFFCLKTFKGFCWQMGVWGFGVQNFIILFRLDLFLLWFLSIWLIHCLFLQLVFSNQLERNLLRVSCSFHYFLSFLHLLLLFILFLLNQKLLFLLAVSIQVLFQVFLINFLRNFLPLLQDISLIASTKARRALVNDHANERANQANEKSSEHWEGNNEIIGPTRRTRCSSKREKKYRQTPFHN